MDKRYQIFVSSTFADLKEERQAVMQALLSLDHFPAGMELFPASNEDQLALIKGVIDDSDYYVLVVGGRYGTTNDVGISYTELEFDYALSKKKPVLAFLHERPEKIPSGKTDLNDASRGRLDKFCEKVKTGRHVKFWSTPEDLMAKVIQAVSAETKRNPQEGWIRANRAIDPTLIEGLRQQIDALKAELEASGAEAPKDAASYASGDDEFTISYRCWVESKVKITDIDLSWDTIFLEVGPVMMKEATEAQMKARLSSELWKYKIDEFPKGAIRHALSDDDFDTIKIQLLALGLIRKSQKKHAVADTIGIGRSPPTANWS